MYHWKWYMTSKRSTSQCTESPKCWRVTQCSLTQRPPMGFSLWPPARCRHALVLQPHWCRWKRLGPDFAYARVCTSDLYNAIFYEKACLEITYLCGDWAIFDLWCKDISVLFAIVIIVDARKFYSCRWRRIRMNTHKSQRICLALGKRVLNTVCSCGGRRNGTHSRHTSLHPPHVTTKNIWTYDAYKNKIWPYPCPANNGLSPSHNISGWQ